MEAVPGHRLLTTSRGSAAEFHGRTVGDHPELAVWEFAVDRPAVVLGSMQSLDVVDADACQRAGVEVVRRRSGGGLVLLEPGAVVWFDVVAPAAQLRELGVGDDVRTSMVWLGEVVAGALGGLGVAGASVHRGPMTCSAWSPLVCFAGLGPGEIVIDGVKLVGISQRRTRSGARFQCSVHTRWSPEAMVPLLAGALPPVELLPAVATLPAGVAVALPPAVALALEG